MTSFSRFIGSVALIVFVITSCKKDDGPAPVSTLVGTWTLISLVTTACSDPLDNMPLTNCSSCPILVFTETTLTTTYPSSSQSVMANYTTGGNALTTTNQGALPGSTSFSDTTTFLVDGTTLTLTITATADNGSCRTVLTLIKS